MKVGVKDGVLSVCSLLSLPFDLAGCPGEQRNSVTCGVALE